MRTLGIDLGTNSIGLALRDPDAGTELRDQLLFFSSIIFKSGVGQNKSKEYSYAAERSSSRRKRRLYFTRREKKWATLRWLIDHGMCPMTYDELEQWSKYDKKRHLRRLYPIDAVPFNQWIKLDFNGDDIPDYVSPYQLRAELMTRQFDFSLEEERHKLGRAIYHIALHRGFKSSKGESLKEQESEAEEAEKKGKSIETTNDSEISDMLKKSELKKAGPIDEYMKKHNLPTVGCAFYQLERDNIRIRGSVYQAVRSQQKDEIKAIYTFQNGLDENGIDLHELLSEKKGEGTLFYKRPLKSQKGLVGKCLLEPDKARCPISHPEFEKFRALSFINNIKYRLSSDKNWETLTPQLRIRLYEAKFLRAASYFKFEEITKWLSKEIGFALSYKEKTINYKDNTSVSGCPVTGRLRNILGDNWQETEIVSNKTRVNRATGEEHQVKYSALDIWHVCFSFDEMEYVQSFAAESLGFDEKRAKQLVTLWGAIQQGYSNLSLKALTSINRFLEIGMKYTDAVLLAKLPDLLGEKWNDNESRIISDIQGVIEKNRYDKRIYNIANTLIANYKAMAVEDKFAEHNTDYALDESDRKDVEKAVRNAYLSKEWEEMPADEKQRITSAVTELYAQFFASESRAFLSLPTVDEAIKIYLSSQFPFLNEKKLSNVYHPSMIEFYAPAQPQSFDGREIRLLGSPVIGAFKNPMAMRVLHILRKQINNLIKDGLVTEDTRIVVETARQFNDANVRAAIKTYQDEREKANKAIAKLVMEYTGKSTYTDDEITKMRLLLDQHDITNSEIPPTENGNKKKAKEKYEAFAIDVKKYKLWLEQGCKSIYTGKPIDAAKLFDNNCYDFEHTIPRSISYDNSLSNLTVCEADFNRNTKKNQIPAQLSKYDEILMRIQPWIRRVEKIKDNINYCRAKSKRATEKEVKDKAIQQRHVWEMELDYWQKKVNAFTMKEVTPGFRASQLNDTRLITKYAFYYLKSAFNRVDVQNGDTTAEFRKILGIQSENEKKDRSNHAHHAVDAAVLTLIPTSFKRDKMLELFYKICEHKALFLNSSSEENDLQKLKSELNIHAAKGITEFIQSQILVNHIGHNVALKKTKRTVRARGKIVYTDRDNQRPMIANGDCIRGNIHLDSFYGAIKPAILDENGKPQRNEDGSFMVEEKPLYVIRRELKYKKTDTDSGFKSWDDLKSAMVDKVLFKTFQEQHGDDFKEACEKGFFTKNKNGELANRVRHIRCFTTIANPIAIKQQTYPSKHDYKQSYYVAPGDLLAMCKYVSNDGKVKEFEAVRTCDVCNNRVEHNSSFIPSRTSKKGETLLLKQVLYVGDILLIYKNNPEELYSLSNAEISKRLYVISGFESQGKKIRITKCDNAAPESELGMGHSIKSFDELPKRIRCGINTLKYLVCGIDFKIENNKIRFK